MTALRVEIIPPEQAGQRLDKALAVLLPDQSRNAITRCIEDGLVRVDTETAHKPSQRVAAGQRVTIEFPSPVPASIPSQDLPLEILFEDEALVAINKPAGLVVHPAAGHADQTLVNALLFHIRDLSGVGGEVRPGIIHRLDKDTTGVMLIAKSDEVHRKLTSAWSTDAVRKEYTALVYGAPDPARGRIDAPIGRDPRDRKRMAVVTGGRRAVTDYELTDKFRYVSLVRCTLITGRTHQIRVHMKHIGHPIVGDPTYSGPQWKGIPDKPLQHVLASMHRQALHAAKLSIVHPLTSERMTFEAPLPDDMRSVIDALRA